MLSRVEAEHKINRIITEEVLNGDKAKLDEIAEKVKARINKTEELSGWPRQIPVEHLKNLIRRVIKENELLFNLGDPQVKDDEIRKELKEINKDIKKTKPEFGVVDTSFSKN